MKFPAVNNIPTVITSPARSPARHPSHLIIEGANDPWIVQRDGYYYWCLFDKQMLTMVISRSKDLHKIATAKKHTVWFPPAEFKQIWAPELHFADGKWYIYFTASHGLNSQHRMHVLESEDDNPLSQYAYKSRLISHPDRWAIDGTVLTTPAGRYFIWSGWEGRTNKGQSLYISKMSNPWTIEGHRVRISHPTKAWEGPIEEGPEVLQHDDKIYLIYSANCSWTDDYCLGELALTGDPLDPKSWKKLPHAVFHKNKNVVGPGHASFVTSLKHRRNWIVYHTAQYSGSGWKRDVHLKAYTWNKDGSPSFGVAL